MLTTDAKRQRTARVLRDLHTERNALSAALDREATDHQETIAALDEARAALARAERERDASRAALQATHDTIAWHHERGIKATIDPHSAVTEIIRKALGLPEGPFGFGPYASRDEERAALAGREREEGT